MAARIWPASASAWRIYTTALQRLLGVPPGAFELVDDEVLRFWFEEIIPTVNKPTKETQ